MSFFSAIFFPIVHFFLHSTNVILQLLGSISTTLFALNANASSQSIWHERCHQYQNYILQVNLRQTFMPYAILSVLKEAKRKYMQATVVIHGLSIRDFDYLQAIKWVNTVNTKVKNKILCLKRDYKVVLVFSGPEPPEIASKTSLHGRESCA